MSAIVTNIEAQKLGQRGGLANSPEQQRTRKLNAYRTLAKRYPTSVKVRQELERLERLAGPITTGGGSQ